LKIENSKEKKKGSLHHIHVFEERNQASNGVNPKLKGSFQTSFNIQARDTLDFDCETMRMF